MINYYGFWCQACNHLVRSNSTEYASPCPKCGNKPLLPIGVVQLVQDGQWKNLYRTDLNRRRFFSKSDKERG